MRFIFLFFIVLGLSHQGAKAQSASRTDLWPTTSKIHIGSRVLLVLHGATYELPCTVSDLGPDEIACEGAHHTAPSVHLRATISIIETAPRDFRGRARLFLKTGGVLLLTSVPCFLLNGSDACAVPLAAGVGLFFAGLACNFIDIHNAITGLNRKRILYTDPGVATAP